MQSQVGRGNLRVSEIDAQGRTLAELKLSGALVVCHPRPKRDDQATLLHGDDMLGYILY